MRTQIRFTQTQLNQMLGTIVHTTLYEGAKHRTHLICNPQRRGVEGWPLLGRGMEAAKHAALKCLGDKGRKALEAKERAKGDELARLSSAKGEQLEEWKPAQGIYWKRSPAVSLGDIWDISATAYGKFQEAGALPARLSIDCDGRPASLANALSDETKVPLSVWLGEGESYVLSKQLRKMDCLRAIRFIVNPVQIEELAQDCSSRFPLGRFRSTAMETAFARSERLRDEAYLFFAKELAGNSDEGREIIARAQIGMMTGKYAFEVLKQKFAAGTPTEQLEFNRVFVLDTKNRISDSFYYSLHAVTDYFGGLFSYWFAEFKNGRLESLPAMDSAGEWARISARRKRLEGQLGGAKNAFARNVAARRLAALGKEAARLEALTGAARKTRAEEALALVKQKTLALVNIYEITAETPIDTISLFGRKCPCIRLDESLVPDGAKHTLRKVQAAYAASIIPNRFYMQNLATVKEAMMIILAGMGLVKVFEKIIMSFSHRADVFIAPFGEVLANALNGVAAMLSGSIRTGPKGEGAEQAEVEHASGKAIKWGLLGGFVASVANLAAISSFRGARLLQSLLHAVSGNFTTQVVFQGGVWGGLFLKSGNVLQRLGLLRKEVNVGWETFKEVNVHNIFGLWQAVIGSVALWISTFAIGMYGIIEEPARAGHWGGVLLFVTAVLETPMAAVGIAISPLINRYNTMKVLERTVDEAEAEADAERAAVR